MNYKHLVTLFPALPMCTCLLGLMVSHRMGAIVYVCVAAITPVLAVNGRISALLERHPKWAVAVAVASWAVTIFRLGWFCGRCSM